MKKSIIKKLKLKKILLNNRKKIIDLFIFEPRIERGFFILKILSGK